MKTLLYLILLFLLFATLLLTCNTVKSPTNPFTSTTNAPFFLEQTSPQTPRIANKSNHYKNKFLKEKRLNLIENENIQISGELALPTSDVFHQKIQVAIQENVVYANAHDLFTTHYGLLPISRTLAIDATDSTQQSPPKKQFEILLGIVDRNTNHGKILQLISSNNQILQQDTLPMFIGNHQDTDEDGIVEFAGFLAPKSTYCTDCDSIYYNPLLIYEMRSTGFVLDSIATQCWIEENYSSFHGFEASDRIVKTIEN